MTAIVAGLVLGGARVLFETVLAPQYRKDQVLREMNLLHTPGTAAVF